MKYKFIKSGEKKEILEQLGVLGISEIPYLLIESGKEKIRGYTGHLSKEEILEIGKLTRVEGIGLYILKRDTQLTRPSFEGVQAFKNQISENIIEISEEEFQKWIRGYDLNKPLEKGIKAIKYKEYFIGIGMSNGQTIFNYVPKERRLKKPLQNPQ